MTKNAGLYALVGAIILVAAIAVAATVNLGHHHHETPAADANMTECERQGEEMAHGDAHHNHTEHLIACGMSPEDAANATSHEDNMTMPDNSTGNMTMG